MSSEPLAVARPFQPNLAKRQGGIPQFLDKLYHMVEDPDTDLIRWSDTGDSFVVTDQERFSKEVLGRWFKHQNFGSFVRQLNLYGFRKVPHLQQGALHSDTSQEPLCFENSNFHRGQPDLLQLISRKKQAATGREDASGEKPSSTSTTTNAARSLTAANPNVDVNGLLTGIAAIKRHQTQISTELTDLKRSNQALWQEAFTARERYQRQQDTVERILKFLAGVFGNAPGATPQSKDTNAKAAPSADLNLQPKRLMIEGSQEKGKGGGAGSSRFVEHPDTPSTQDEDWEHADFSTPPPENGAFASISAVTSPAATTPFATDPRHGTEVQNQPLFSLHDIMPSESTPRPSEETSAHNAQNSTASPSSGIDPALASLISSNSTAQADSMFNSGILAALLNSPSNLQRVMSALNTLSPVTTPTKDTYGSDMALTQSGASLPSPPAFSLDPASFTNGWPPVESSALLDPSHSEMFASSALANNGQRLQKMDDSTGRLDSHIDAMDTSIHSLLETLGVPADALNGQTGDMSFDQLTSNFGAEPLNFDHLHHPVTSSGDSLAASADAGLGDAIDWNSFFPQLDGSGAGEDGMNTFDSDAGTTSPVSTAPVLDAVEPKVPAKRKSEAVEPVADTSKPKRNTRKKR